MILVDTSVWIEYFRKGDETLESLLDEGQVLMHPYVMGELACGALESRERILRDFTDMPQLGKATDEEVLYYIEHHQLMGSGVGYLDAHLLASVHLAENVRLWTRDKKLSVIADQLSVLH